MCKFAVRIGMIALLSIACSRSGEDARQREMAASGASRPVAGQPDAPSLAAGRSASAGDDGKGGAAEDGTRGPAAGSSDMPPAAAARADAMGAPANGSGGIGGTTVTAGMSTGSAADVQIRRTAFGVPHVRAADEAGLGYGVGYAYAEDNVCVFADSVVTASGERSKYYGPTGTYDPTGFSSITMLGPFPSTPPRTNLASDFYYKYVNEPSLVQASWERQPKDVQDLLTGYAAGYNRHLNDTTAAGVPDACRGKPWVREISALDLIRGMRRLAVEFGGALFIDPLYAAAPPSRLALNDAPSARAGDRPESPALLRLDPRAPSLGSNGVALGRDATASGKGLLLANPHFPWAGEFRFYQLHLTIPGKLDVMGVTLGGFPMVVIGWNAQVAWTHTAHPSYHFTLFELELDPSDPTRYIVDGQSRSMTKQTLTVELPSGHATHDYYHSDYGPVLDLAPLFNWTRRQAFALGDANFDNDRLIEQWWALDKATSVMEYKASIEQILGIPWVNAIAADEAGSVYFTGVSPVPNVSKDKQRSCVPLAYRTYAEQGLLVLRGNTARCNWDDDPAAPRKGIFPASKLPTLVRTDYVQNSNNSAWMTNPSSPLVGFPSIVSTDSMPLAGRTRYGLTQITERLAGTDGLPGNKFDAGSLQQLSFSNRSAYADALLSDLKSACSTGGNVLVEGLRTVDIGKGCEVIKNWDGTAELASIGYPLFQTWRHAMESSLIDYWTIPFDPENPANTPRGLRISDPLVLYTARAGLGQAMTDLDARGLDYTKPWGEIQVTVRGSERIPIHGGESDDVYNTIQGKLLSDGQLDVVMGSSSIWTVSFEGESPKVQGFLTYSQSVNPSSPHYTDQTKRFSEKAWITYPFTDAEIAADPELQVKELQR